jgi:Cupin superfamily protein
MSSPSLAEGAFTLAFPGLSVEAVLAMREAAVWRLLPGDAPDRFRSLVSVADLDAFLLTDAARTSRVSMADGGRTGSAAVPKAEFALDSGHVDAPRLMARFDAGATLVVSQFQDMHPPLARFCRGLEKLFLHAVQCNVYLTPASAQGFRVHYDTHDVVVLQVEGRKQWRLWPDQPLPHPTRKTPWQRDIAPEGEPVEFTLRAGDALYLPRGVLHDARTQEADGHSLHLTIGLMEPCWAEALRNALEMMEATDPALREAFPSWRLGDAEQIPALLRAMAARLEALSQAPVLEKLALRMLDGLAQNRIPLPGRGLLTPPPKADDRLRLSDAMHHHVAALPDGSAELRWADGTMRLDERSLAWLERLDAGATPSELGDGALAFCRKLAAAGLLMAAEGR